jgi:hypothetical protein
MYLSQRDAVGFFRKVGDILHLLLPPLHHHGITVMVVVWQAIEVDMKPAVGDIPFMMAYAVSNNDAKALHQAQVALRS